MHVTVGNCELLESLIFDDNIREVYLLFIQCGIHVAYAGDIRRRLTISHCLSIVYCRMSGVSFTWIPPWLFMVFGGSTTKSEKTTNFTV